MSHVKIAVSLLVLAAGSLCGAAGSGHDRPAVPKASQATTPVTLPDAVGAASRPTQTGGEIRGVDFKNFTYPTWRSIRGGSLLRTETVSLRDGELEVPENSQGNEDPIDFSLSDVSYHDLTHDGREEAIVTLTAFPYPRGSSTCVYVYTLEGEPRLLLQYEFGSAADGGLRRLGVEGDSLVIERYVSDKSTAYCCPEKYRRSFYSWDGKTFKERRSEELVNESKAADFLGYPSSNK